MKHKKQQSKMYFRPVSQFNNGKQSEFKERVWFTEDKAMKGKDCGKRKQTQEATK